MTQPRVLILRAPGTNCDIETSFAFETAGALPTSIHIQQLIERPSLAEKFQILCFPGGFSYGDDIASGRVLATQLKSKLPDIVERFQSEDRLVLGICNGFQIMIRLGIFFEDPGKPLATLTWNRQGRFEDRWVNMIVDSTESPFLKGIDRWYLPMAHAEGRFVIRDESAKQELIGNQQIPLRYCSELGQLSDDGLDFPDNPNGADLNVAGMTDRTGRIFGMMPHPERHLFPTHHPAWTRREPQPEHGEGLKLFQNAVEYFS